MSFYVLYTRTYIESYNRPLYFLAASSEHRIQKYLVLYIGEPLAQTLRVISFQSKKISNDQEPIQSDSKSCSQNQKGNN